MVMWGGSGVSRRAKLHEMAGRTWRPGSLLEDHVRRLAMHHEHRVYKLGSQAERADNLLDLGHVTAPALLVCAGAVPCQVAENSKLKNP
jgi:hypothetical protein